MSQGESSPKRHMPAKEVSLPLEGGEVEEKSSNSAQVAEDPVTDDYEAPELSVDSQSGEDRDE